MRMSYWSSDVCSSDRGTAVMKAAAEGLRDVSFELGGKNSAIIFADADLDAAIEGIVRSVFLNCGQVCLGTERVLVERPLFDRFVSALKAKAEALRPGHRSEEHTSELQSLMRISYAVFCFKKKNQY